MGSSVDSKNSDLETPLHFACSFGDEEIVSILLNNGAKVNSKDKCHITPLHWASFIGNISIINLLLSTLYKSDRNYTIFNELVTSRDKFGDTPIELAKVFGHHDVMNLLINNTKKYQSGYYFNQSQQSQGFFSKDNTISSPLQSSSMEWSSTQCRSVLTQSNNYPHSLSMLFSQT